MTALTGQDYNTAAVDKCLQDTQAQVYELVDIVSANVDKVLQRDQKISELVDRSDALKSGAYCFKIRATKLKRKFWWQNCKMLSILLVVSLTVVVTVVVWAVS